MHAGQDQARLSSIAGRSLDISILLFAPAGLTKHPDHPPAEQAPTHSTSASQTPCVYDTNGTNTTTLVDDIYTSQPSYPASHPLISIFQARLFSTPAIHHAPVTINHSIPLYILFIANRNPSTYQTNDPHPQPARFLLTQTNPAAWAAVTAHALACKKTMPTPMRRASSGPRLSTS